MKNAQILRSIERIEGEIARLQAEASSLRALITREPVDSSSRRKPTLAFPRARDEAASPSVEPPPEPARSPSGRVQHAALPVDTIPPASRQGSAPRVPKARDTIPVAEGSPAAPSPPAIPRAPGLGLLGDIAPPARPPRSDPSPASLVAGRYGFVPEPRDKPPRP